MKRLFVFVFNLVQDVSICRPIIALARARFECDILILRTVGFGKRDVWGVWSEEVSRLVSRFGVEVREVQLPSDAVWALQGRSGTVFAASESDLPAHEIVHDILRCAPRGFLKVTLQHGLECIGFAHNNAHDRAHGDRVGFAADIVVGWSDENLLYSMAPSQRGKLFVAGPSLLLEPAPEPSSTSPGLHGLICENLHSVRIGAASRQGFLDIFRAFAAEVAGAGGSPELRPHPGGRYTDKAKIKLPPKVKRNIQPLFRQNLRRFAFGLSAPSTILLDLLLARVPVAVWQDEDDTLDLSNYEGLTVARSADDWWRFAYQAVHGREALMARQQAFVDRLGFPADVPKRYETLLRLAA